MGRLKIKSLKYEGKNYYYYNNRFKDGINVLLGDNGNGKSTFTYLILYALGNKIEYFEKNSNEVIKEVFNDTDKYVELNIEINGKGYILNRKIPSPFISVYNISHNKYATYNIVRNGTIYEKDNQNFSDWILSELEIDIVEINQYSTSHKINFDDLFRLMYYDQKTPNSEIISYFGIDYNNFFKTSSILKRSIFEILISNYFKDYYKTYYEIKGKQKEKDEKVESKKVIEALIENIKSEIEFDDKLILHDVINSKRAELKRIDNIRKQSIESQDYDEYDDFNMDRINELQEEITLLIVKRNSLELELDEAQEDLNKALQVKTSLENDINYLDKILFTSKIYNVINEDTCPFCFEKINNKDKCICGSNKKLDYEKFIYSDKEYLEIMKSKIKGLTTTNDTIEFCKQEVISHKNNINKITDKVSYLLNTISEISKEMSRGTNFAGIDQLTERVVELKEQLIELELLESKINELTIIEKEIDKLDNILKNLKIKLDQLEEEKNNILSENLTVFINKYDNWIREFYDTKEINVSLDRNYKPVIGYYQEQSFNVPKRFLYYLSLLNLSIEKEINYPKFVIIDTLKSEGIDLNRLKKLIPYLNKLKGNSFQVVMTTGYEEFSYDLNWNIIDELTDNNKLLKKK